MKVKIVCDDDYETFLQVPEELTFGEIVDELLVVRKSQDASFALASSANQSSQNGDTNSSFSFLNPGSSKQTPVFSTSVQFVSLNQNNRKSSSSADISDIQHISLRYSLKDVLSSNTTKNKDIVVYVHGFRTQQQTNVVNQFYQFSNKLSLMNMALNHAIEKYTEAFPPQAPNKLTIENGSSRTPIQELSERISSFYNEIKGSFDDVLNRHDLDATTKSTLTRAKASFAAGDIAGTLSTLEFPAIHAASRTEPSSSSALIPHPNATKQAPKQQRKNSKTEVELAALAAPAPPAPAAQSSSAPAEELKSPQKLTQAQKKAQAKAAAQNKTAEAVAAVASPVSKPAETVVTEPVKAPIVPTPAPAVTAEKGKKNGKAAVKDSEVKEPVSAPAVVPPAPVVSAKPEPPAPAASKKAGAPKNQPKAATSASTIEPPKVTEVVPPKPTEKPAAVVEDKQTFGLAEILAAATREKQEKKIKEQQEQLISKEILRELKNVKSSSESDSDSDSSESSESSSSSSASSASSSSGSSVSSSRSSSSSSSASSNSTSSVQKLLKLAAEMEKEEEEEQLPPVKKQAKIPPAAITSPKANNKQQEKSNNNYNNNKNSNEEAKASAITQLETQPILVEVPPVVQTEKIENNIELVPKSNSTAKKIAEIPKEIVDITKTETTKPSAKTKEAVPIVPSALSSSSSSVASRSDSDSGEDSDSESNNSKDSESDSESSSSSSVTVKKGETTKKGLILTNQTSVKKPTNVMKTPAGKELPKNDPPAALKSLLQVTPNIMKPPMNMLPAHQRISSSTKKEIPEKIIPTESSESESSAEENDKDDDIGNLPKIITGNKRNVAGEPLPQSISTRPLRSNSKSDLKDLGTKAGAAAVPAKTPAKATAEVKATNNNNKKQKTAAANKASLRDLVEATPAAVVPPVPAPADSQETVAPDEIPDKAVTERAKIQTLEANSDEEVIFQAHAPPSPSPVVTERKKPAGKGKGAAPAGSAATKKASATPTTTSAVAPVTRKRNAGKAGLQEDAKEEAALAAVEEPAKKPTAGGGGGAGKGKTTKKAAETPVVAAPVAVAAGGANKRAKKA